jgi:ribosomal protein S18 acetylase RimI-like enzyme
VSSANAVFVAATEADIPAMVSLLQSCAEHMHQQGMSHWLGVYDVDSVSANLAQKSVYLAKKDHQIVGCIAVNEQPSDYYAECWPDALKADFYITQLAVSPAQQQQGIGKFLMQQAMKSLPSGILQLDAVDHYPALLAFYKNLGFEIIRSGIGLGDKRHLFQLEL